MKHKENWSERRMEERVGMQSRELQSMEESQKVGAPPTLVTICNRHCNYVWRLYILDFKFFIIYAGEYYTGLDNWRMKIKQTQIIQFYFNIN